MVEAKEYVLDAETEVGGERVCRPALRLCVGGDGDVRLAMLALEHHLFGAAGPLNVGDGVMVGAEHGVAAVSHREIADGRRARIEHNDFDAGALGGRWPYLGGYTGGRGAGGRGQRLR